MLNRFNTGCTHYAGGVMYFKMLPREKIRNILLLNHHLQRTSVHLCVFFNFHPYYYVAYYNI